MEELKSMLLTLQQEIRQQKVDLQEAREDIKNTINEKFKSLEAKNAILEEKIESQNSRINYLERSLRKKNLLFFGVEETEKNYMDLERKVLDIINNVLKVKCDSSCMESVRRLGQRGEKVRPIVLTLVTLGLKIQIQKNKKKLETTTYYIKEDFPLDVLNKRRELQQEVNKERELGKLAIIKYDKIVYLKNRNQESNSQNTEKKKRNLSISPEASKPEYGHQSTQIEKQPTKITKTNSMSNYILKKPTLNYPAESSIAQSQPEPHPQSSNSRQ